jgi:hypothetical protein
MGSAVSWSSGGLFGEERVAVDVKLPGLLLALGIAEGVNSLADAHVDESGVLEHFLPAHTGQPTGNSSRPEVDIPDRLLGHLDAVGDVGELEHPAGPQNAEELGEAPLLVGDQVEHPVGDDHVGPAVVDG